MGWLTKSFLFPYAVHCTNDFQPSLTLKHLQWCCRTLYSRFKPPGKSLSIISPLQAVYKYPRDLRKLVALSSSWSIPNTQAMQVGMQNTRCQAAMMAPQGNEEHNSSSSCSRDYPWKSPVTHRWRSQDAAHTLAGQVAYTWSWVAE